MLSPDCSHLLRVVCSNLVFDGLTLVYGELLWTLASLPGQTPQLVRRPIWHVRFFVKARTIPSAVCAVASTPAL